MKKIDLIYFTGCPFVEKAREALRQAGATSFSEINIDKLDAASRFRHFTSPSILIDEQLVLGKRSDLGMACSIVDWTSADAILKKYIR